MRGTPNSLKYHCTYRGSARVARLQMVGAMAWARFRDMSGTQGAISNAMSTGYTAKIVPTPTGLTTVSCLFEWSNRFVHC